ncbi:hypothetical protein [Cedecea sp. P7760]|uniref:hypothetical protein n=1 Tax=Cedecea sp. P7760 TaxID=2726983 RepID=UPI0015A16F50|nr:hypothetical protein [Cedecea sp. P7760]NWC63720.1 hypothetical protein [Cedecea sp. P7760]
MTYKYVNPCEKGFVRIPITRKQHNRFIPNRKQKFGAKVEYYWLQENNTIEAQYFCSWWMKALLITVMFLPAILMQGVPETIRDIGNLIHERERGKFSADRWHLNQQKTTDGELEAFIAAAIKKS